MRNQGCIYFGRFLDKLIQGSRGKEETSMSNNKITVTFQQIFSFVLLLTLLSGGASLCLTSRGKISEQQNRILEIANTTWEVGLGAIFELAIITVVAHTQNSSQKTSDDL